MAAYWDAALSKGGRQWWSALRRRAFGRRRHAVVMSTRRVDGFEPYSSAVRREIGDDALLLDHPHTGDPPGSRLNFPALKQLFRKRYRQPEAKLLTRRDRALSAQIRAHFMRTLGIDPGDIAELVQRRVASFRSLEKGFRKFFKVESVDTLFLTNGYSAGTQAVISGARHNDVYVVELQHGFISPFHLGYSWPGKPDVPYGADELWCFGPFWPQVTPLPRRLRTRIIGAPYIRELASQYDGPRDDALVVFTSQGVVGLPLFRMAIETARRRPDRRVIFRLHPKETLGIYEDALTDLGPAPLNFELSHRKPNIFALLARTSVQVGAFSTTLLEGMLLGSRTVVVNLPGCEYMRPVVERGDALFARDVDELVARLDEAPLAADPELYYARPAKRLL